MRIAVFPITLRRAVAVNLARASPTWTAHYASVTAIRPERSPTATSCTPAGSVWLTATSC